MPFKKEKKVGITCRLKLTPFLITSSLPFGLVILRKVSPIDFLIFMLETKYTELINPWNVSTEMLGFGGPLVNTSRSVTYACTSTDHKLKKLTSARCDIQVRIIDLSSITFNICRGVNRVLLYPGRGAMRDHR